MRILATFGILSALCVGDGRAETISHALALAYSGNPDLNQQRAGLRATDENVARAKSLFRPQVFGTGSVGYNYIDERLGFGNGTAALGSAAVGTAAASSAAGLTANTIRGSTLPRTAALTVTENIFNGNKSTNSVRQAESQVFATREQTRNVEQATLLAGATVYMDVLRDAAILGLASDNITVLEEQLRQTRHRYDFGEVTRTDLSQAETSLATARSNFSASRGALRISLGNYRRVIGVEPRRLEAARPITSLLPHDLAAAVAQAQAENPVIQASLHNVDAAALQVQINESSLYPTLNVVGSVQAANDFQGLPGGRLFNGAVLGQLNIPLYSGGESFAAVRQAKELLAQARLQVDLQRNNVRSAVDTAWSQLETAHDIVRSTRAAVKSAEMALNGVREEAKSGQRTTQDILIAQQTLLQARVGLVSAERDQVVASYATCAAIGRLSAANLALDVVTFDPTLHLEQVKDKWSGLRTPSGM